MPPPRRLLAIGGAGLVTLLTVGGALGFGPGAAMGDTDRRTAERRQRGARQRRRPPTTTD